jgi:uncharacterized cysteine cluster protein YcgN (CxxCxxCC family)
MTRALAAVLVASLAACSGSEGSGKESTTPADPVAKETPEQQKQAESERKLHAAQESAVEALCERLADCAVEDAMKMSPEERKEKIGNVDELLPRARAQCEEEANRSNLSPRQVKVVQKCVSQEKTCESLLNCLDEAKKK